MKCFWTIKRMLLLDGRYSDTLLSFVLIWRGWDLLCYCRNTSGPKTNKMVFGLLLLLLISTFFYYILCHVCKINLTTSLWLQHHNVAFSLFLLWKKDTLYTLFTLFFTIQFELEMDVTFPCMVCFGRTSRSTRRGRKTCWWCGVGCCACQVSYTRSRKGKYQ